MGVDGALIVAPYYNKPSQEGLFRHFQAIARSTALPIMLYNIPGRCGVDIGADTVERLAYDCGNIVSIKEASGSVDRVSELRIRMPEAFTILSGDDGLTLPFMAAGAVGVVSVASNLLPAEVCALVDTVPSRRHREYRAGIAPPPGRHLQGSLHRAESGAGEDRARLARRDVERSAVAAVRDDGGKRGAAAQDTRRLRADRLMSAAVRVLLVGARAGWGGRLRRRRVAESQSEIIAECDQGDDVRGSLLRS